MTTTREEALELLGRVRDRCDNLLQAATMPIPLALHVECLVGGLRSIREQVAAVIGEEDGEE